jgi:hypothetical protein
VNVALEIIEIGMAMTYRGRAHVVAGISPMSVTPQVIELRDIEAGSNRTVSVTDESLGLAHISPTVDAHSLMGAQQMTRRAQEVAGSSPASSIA